MFSEYNLDGSRLPKKTLCFTFDDGPGETVGTGRGPKTLKIAEWLKENEIAATFFMLGRHLVQYPNIAAEVSKLGHIIGNHAFCHHKNFLELFDAKWDYFSEIEITDELIRIYNPNHNIYFRPPWGSFSPELAIQMNREISNGLNHIGPFLWDIGGNDWSYWLNGMSAEQCAEYLWNDIQNKDHGIVLMHDSTADLLVAKRNNLTFETLQILIPRLKGEGYHFVNLDQAPIH
jgi:peptidoglycan/xylan/chitin deacetylase (PgdA/CDA1 family)